MASPITQAAPPNVDYQTGGYASGMAAGQNIGAAVDAYVAAKRTAQQLNERRNLEFQRLAIEKQKADSETDLHKRQLAHIDLQMKGQEIQNKFLEEIQGPAKGIHDSMLATQIQDPQQAHQFLEQQAMQFATTGSPIAMAGMLGAGQATGALPAPQGSSIQQAAPQDAMAERLKALQGRLAPGMTYKAGPLTITGQKPQKPQKPVPEPIDEYTKEAMAHPEAAAGLAQSLPVDHPAQPRVKAIAEGYARQKHQEYIDKYGTDADRAMTRDIKLIDAEATSLAVQRNRLESQRMRMTEEDKNDREPEAPKDMDPAKGKRAPVWQWQNDMKAWNLRVATRQNQSAFLKIQEDKLLALEQDNADRRSTLLGAKKPAPIDLDAILSKIQSASSSDLDALEKNLSGVK